MAVTTVSPSSTRAPVAYGGSAAVPWYQEFGWVLGVAMLGFSVPAMFVGFLHWPRGWFVLPYALAGLAYVFLYVRWTGIDLSARLRRHWLPGTLAGVAVAVFVVVNVLAQPASPTPTGLELIGALLWLGVLFVSGRRCVNSIGQ